MFKLFGGKDHKKALKKALGEYELPSFPAVATQVLDLLRKDTASASAVADVLALDPGLSVKVLATVNSAAYSPRRRVDNLPQAVAMLGMSNLETLVIAVAVGATVPRVPCEGFQPRRFWLAAARRAATAQALAELLHPASRSESFTAALLQDMAIPLLVMSRPKVYGPILTRWHAGEAELQDLERDELGFDHAEAGTWLCAEWSLPASLAAAIGSHHRPLDALDGCPPAVALVSRLRETEDRSGVDELVALAHEHFGLPEEVVSNLVHVSFESAGDLADLFC